MAKKARSEDAWDVEGALRVLRSQMDPYLWEQGQELYRRGGAEDVAIQADGTVQVRVVDPRDARVFFVAVRRRSGGLLDAVCRCPYRLGGFCRHQVVALEYLRAVAEGEVAAAEPGANELPPAGTREAGVEAARPSSGETKDLLLYRLFARGAPVATRPDGSMLRVVLHALGSSRTLHHLSLQLFTGTGWTDLRTPDAERWIGRGGAGPHPRDALLASSFIEDGVQKNRVDSEMLARVLAVVAGSDVLVDRTGRQIDASLRPWRLSARLVRGAGKGVGVEFHCRSAGEASYPFDEVSIVPSVAPWIQLETGAFHPLIAGTPGPLLERLQEEDYSEIPPDELDQFLSEGVEHLQMLCPEGLETEPGLIREVEGVDGARVQLEGNPRRLAGHLELSYGGEWVDAPESPEPWTVERDGEIHRYPPAGQSLARARRELEGLGFRRSEDKDRQEDPEGWVLEGPGALARVLKPRVGAFVEFVLPGKLSTFDLVERGPTLRLNIAAPGDFRAEIGSDGSPVAATGRAAPGGPQGSSGIAWLEASFALADGDRCLDVDLDHLRKALAEDPEGLLQLDDGTVLGLAHETVRTLAELAETASGAPGAADGSAPSSTACPGAASPGLWGSLRLPLAAVSELLDERAGLEVEFEEGIRPLVQILKRDDSLPAPALRDSIAEILRPYQKEAVRWFQSLARWSLGGILADEMGLGKTVMVLSHLFGLAREKAPGGGAAGERAPVLVVCPTSLVFNWLDECRRFFPEVEVVGLQGQPAARRGELIREGAELLVTSYALLRRDREPLESRSFRAVILDEAQHIKNADSQTAHAAFALRAAERWVLTGTPVENHLGELWSLFHFTMPGFLAGRSEFRERYSEPIRRGDRDVLSRLRSRVRPFILRRTKEQVLPELPPCIEQVERVEMTGFQRRLYEDFLLRVRSELAGGTGGEERPKARFKILAALTRLRQICCHPSLVLKAEGVAPSGAASRPGREPEAAEPTSGKFELLLELLEECIEEGHRVLLFSQFTSMLDLVEAELEEQGVRRCRLDGGTKDREGVVRKFREDPEIPVFLISLKAGGQGLNLTQADTVILYDPWWNPAVEDQAAARAHRMGQSLPVHVHKLVTAGTIEEKIIDLQASKKDLAESVVSAGDAGAEAFESLSFEELEALIND